MFESGKTESGNYQVGFNVIFSNRISESKFFVEFEVLSFNCKSKICASRLLLSISFAKKSFIVSHQKYNFSE